MLKVLSLVVGVSIGVAIFMVGQWYVFVTGTNNPHDDAGTQLNALMPAPMNRWGCDRLRERFPDTVPPEGCEEAAGTPRR